jgi:hypothetical protein
LTTEYTETHGNKNNQLLTTYEEGRKRGSEENGEDDSGWGKDTKPQALSVTLIFAVAFFVFRALPCIPWATGRCAVSQLIGRIEWFYRKEQAK